MRLRRKNVNKLNKYVLSSVVGLLLVSAPVNALEVSIEEGLSKANSLIEFSKQIYVHEIDNEAMFEGTYHGLFKALDDDSVYYNADEFQVLLNQLNSTSTGVGLAVDKTEDKIKVVTVYKGSSAQTQGIRPGDEIVLINGEDISDKDESIVDGLLSGTAYSNVSVQIKREGIIQPLDIELTRQQMNPNQVEYSNMNGIGYIKINVFTQVNVTYVEEALKALIDEQQIKGLIIDVRNNTGGEIDAIYEILDLLTPLDQALMNVDYRTFEDTAYTSVKEGYATPLKILVNERTVGGPELFAGALQANGRAEIIGQKTIGDGRLQWVAPLEDGSGLKMTIGLVQFGNNAYLDGFGIQPDGVVNNENLEMQRVYERFVPMNLIQNSTVWMKNKDVLGAQQRLSYLGYATKENSYFDKETELALAYFQRDNGLLNSGILNWETKAKLDEKVREKASQIIDDIQLSQAIEWFN